MSILDQDVGDIARSFIAKVRSRRRLIKAAKAARQRVVDNEHATLIITRTSRRVRLTVEARTPRPAVAFVDLDEAGIDRAIKRLQALRGGRRTLP